MRWPGGVRRRFLLGAIASAVISLIVFAAVVFTLVALEDEDSPDAPGEGVAEAGELVVEAMMLAGPVALIAAVVTAAILARRTARPLEQAIAAARRSSAHDLSHRLEVPAERGELRELAIAQNELFARLDDGFGALARFAADASHELRTPLTVMAAELELALRDASAPEPWRAVAAGTLAETRRLSAIVDGLLALARAGADAPGQRRVLPLLEVVDAITAQLEATAEARAVRLTGPATPCASLVHGDPITLETALRNLVDNAIRHARTRVDVDVALGPDGHAVEVRVDDDGPGLGDEPARLFAPMVRGAGADRQAGAGLGLTIARRAIEAHGGTLGSGTSPSGGARLIMSLPLAADDAAPTFTEFS